MPQPPDRRPLITISGLTAEIDVILDDLGHHNAQVLAERLMAGYLNFPARIELHGPSGEWSALYIDGELVQVGDTYVAQEALNYHVLPITMVDNADFMRGQSSRDGVAQTTEEVRYYTAHRTQREASAAQKRAQATQLLAEADALESGA